MAEKDTSEKDVKRQKTNEYMDVCGYIHEVSPIKISEKNNSYFICKIQTEKDVNDMVCLSPEKWKHFKNAEKEDSGVSVSNVRCQLENRKEKLFTNYRSVLMNVSKPLGFNKKQQLIVHEEIKSITIEDVYLKPLDVCGFYSLSGKVINVAKAIEVMIYGSRKYCQNVVITDGNHKLNISMYGSLIDVVERGKSYRFSNVGLRKVNGVSKLTARKQTVIDNIDYVLEGDKFDVGKNDVDSENMLIDVNGVKCELKVKCPCCSKDIDYESVKHVATVRCTKCNMLTKTAKLVAIMTTRIDGSDENKVNQKLTVHNFVMKQFVEKVNKEHLLMNAEGLEEFIIKQTSRMQVVIDNSNINEVKFDPLVE